MCVKKNLILADSSFHLLLAAALSKKLGTENCIILFLGKDNSYLTKLFFSDFNIENYYIQDLSFFNIRTKYKSKVNDLKKNDINFLYTFYDTNHVFEFLMNELNLSWNNVGLIDDGSASLHRVTMPKLYRRLPKALFNFSLSRFPVNLSRYNLGGNTKIRFFATIYLNYVFISNPNSKIIDINIHYNNILNNLDYFNLKNQLISGSIIILSPVLAYKRKTELELLRYLKDLLLYCDKNKPIYFKPHPREDLVALKNVIYKLDIKHELLSSVIPMELYFSCIHDSTWLGMPSTSIFNRVFTNTSSVDKYIILQEKNDPFPERLNILSKVFKDFSIDYKIYKTG